MLGLVILLRIIVERQKSLFLDTRRLRRWFSVAFSLLMLISMYLFRPFSLDTLIDIKTTTFVEQSYRFHELRDALEKLQLNDAALKVGLLLLSSFSFA